MLSGSEGINKDDCQYGTAIVNVEQHRAAGDPLTKSVDLSVILPLGLQGGPAKVKPTYYPAPGRYRERGIVFARFLSFFLAFFLAFFLSFFLSLFVSLFLCQQDYEKTAGPICMKFSGKVWSDHGTTRFNFGSIRVNGSPQNPPKPPNSPKWGSR